jgi:uncharacterized membrane protein YccC
MGVRLNEVSDQKDASPQRRRFRRTADGIVAELRLVRLRGDRGRLCAETVASVVLAVYLADIFNLKERWWVALSAYVLIRSNPWMVFRRCLERLTGTVIGATGGALLAVLVFHDAWLTILALALISGLGIYCMLGSPYAYSWVLGTVTALMVLSDPVSTALPTHLAINRILDVAVGVLAAATISAVVFCVERLLRGDGSSVSASSADASGAHKAPASPIVGHLRSSRIWQAVQGAFAIALIGGVNHFHMLPNFAQSMVSVVALLLVPLSVLVDGQVMEAVHMRMFNRFLGCLCAALLAALLLPLIGGIPLLCLLVLGAGVWLAAHIQAGSVEVSYIGTQFGVGFIMIFVQDHAWSTDASAALQRLMGIVVALFVLAATMAAFSAVAAQYARIR